VDDVLLTLLAVLLVPVAVLTMAAAGLLGWLRRNNRVAPGVPLGTAPFTWLWSPGAAATLHRRLRAACQLAASVAGPPSHRRWSRRHRPLPPGSIAQLAREVVDEAMRLDRELVATRIYRQGMGAGSAGAPVFVARAHALAALDYEVRGVEDAARRVHNLATRRGLLGGGPGPGDLSLSDRIASMEAAMGELQPRP